MTRENKLALVVGFALILVVGILISDHFSPARNHEAAELATVEDPLDGSRIGDERLVVLRPNRVDARPDRSPESDPVARDPVAIPPLPDRSEDRPERSSARPSTPGPGDRGSSSNDRSTAPASPDRFHDVRKGETLTAICRQYYGDAALLDAFIAYNTIDRPDLVNVGRRLRIPPIEALRPGGSSRSGGMAQANAAANERPASSRTYTVKPGDSLTEIASSLLGTSKAYVRIFELNRDKLDSPDDIREGMVLRIPSS
jgi:nucleoid-associated protein YgaU